MTDTWPILRRSPDKKKTCQGDCQREQLLGFFQPDKESDDGHSPICQDCTTRERAKKKRRKGTGSVSW